MAVIVANVYQQAAMCVTEKHRAPKWLTKFALRYMSPILHMDDKVKAVMSQAVSADIVCVWVIFFFRKFKFV